MPGRSGIVSVLIKAVRWLAGLVFAAWSVLLIAWLILHWAILPHIEQWRRPIEARASAALGAPVRIGNIIVTSSGWVPSLELQDVSVLDTQGAAALKLPRVLAALSPRSLLSFQLRFEQLLIEGAHLEVRRDAQGRLWVAGFDFNGAGGDGRGAADWFFQQHEFVVRKASMRWTDEQLGAAPLSLSDVSLVVRNGLRRHDVRLDATPPAEWGDRFSLRGRFTQSLLAERGDWRRWSGSAHIELPRADVRQLRQHVKLPFDLTQGDGAVRAWVDVRDGQPSAVTLDVALRTVELRLRPDLEPLTFEQVEGRLVGQRNKDGASIALQQFGFLTAEGVRWPRSDMTFAWQQRAGEAATGGQLTAERLDLGLMAQVTARLPFGDNARRLLAELDPVGVVNGLQLRWSGPLDAPDTYDVKAALADVSLQAKPSAEPQGVGRPGLRNADIQLQANQNGGQAQLSLAGGAIDLPGVFDEARLPFDQFSSQLTWRIDKAKAAGALPKITLQVKDAKFANADAQGELRATWSTGAGTGLGKGGRYPGQLELDAKIGRGVAARAARYLPLGIPEDVRLYVQQAVRAGSVANVSFRVKGDLHEFPFYRSRNAREGEFRITARAEDVTLAYVPSLPPHGLEPAFTSPWPAITNLNGELVFDRAAMEIRNAQGQLSGVALSAVQGGISNLAEHSVLALQGTARGPLADMLRFVNTSPVGGWIGKALAQTTASGNAELKLALNVPLADVAASTVKGSVALNSNDVRINPETMAFGAARGKVDFTQKGFTVNVASARLLGGEASFDGGSLPDGAIRFAGSGIASADGLRRAGGPGAPPELAALSRLSGALTGQAAYRVALGLVHGRTELSVTSNLVGMAVDLPAPLRKPAETALSMRYQNVLAADTPAGQPAQRDSLRFELGPVVQAQFQRDLLGDAPRVLRGGIGVMEAPPTPVAGVAANVTLANLNVDAWEKAGARLFGTAASPGAAMAMPAGDAAPGASTLAGYVPTSIGLRVQEFSAGSRKLNRLVAGLTNDDGQWRANLSADQLNGYVEYRPARRAASSAAVDAAGGRVYARLARLSLPKSDADTVEQLLEQPATSMPALDIVVDDFELRGKRLGRFEVEAVNRAVGDGRAEGPAASREWRLTRLALTMPEARLSASGNWAAVGATGPSAGGSTAQASRRSVMNFKLDLNDSGALLERLGLGKTVRGGKGALSGQVAWLGSPLSPDYASMTGQMGVAIESGQFLKAEPGASRLLSVLSLQSLPRRLALDFRDVFQQGFAFDSINGNLQVQEGVAHTNNLRMRGAQAAVLMEGSADIESETQDMRVVIVPEINAGTASLAYAAINPAIGLGTFLAQMFLRKPLTQAGTREFHVTGPWSDPKVDRVERKFSDAVPDIEAPALAIPPAAPGLPVPMDAGAEPMKEKR